jgi:hypothetical protein
MPRIDDFSTATQVQADEWEKVWKNTMNALTTPPKVVKEFDRDILKRIGDTLHMLMPSVDISIRNAVMEVQQHDGDRKESAVLPGAKLVEVRKTYVLRMEMKFSAANPDDFLKEPELPNEEVRRVFRVD